MEEQLTPTLSIPTKKSNPWALVGAGIAVLAAGIGIGLLLAKNIYPPLQILPASSPSPIATADPTANWTVITNVGLNYSLKLPPDWKIIEHSSNFNETYENYRSSLGEWIDIIKTKNPRTICHGDCPVIDSAVETKIGAYPAMKYEGYIGEVGGNVAHRYITYNLVYNSYSLDITFHPSTEGKKPGGGIVPLTQHEEALFDQILSTFKFLGQDPNSEGKFCGGIAGNLPQNQCPSGYICKLDGNYPDASGRCEKPQMGTLNATVLRSPTCAGAQRPGETCEAPVVNETFKIIRLYDGRVVQTVNTDNDGKFTVSLPADRYELLGTYGISKRIGTPGFTIAGNKTTIQQFDIDTGIR